MERLCINDIVCSKNINYFRVLDKYKDKSVIEIIIDAYTNKASQYCKKHNLEITEFSIRKHESDKYEIEIKLGEYGNNNL